MAGAKPTAESIDRLRKALLVRQRALFHDVEGVEDDLRALEESGEVEIETRSQELATDRLLDRIREHDRQALEAIHRALAKIAAGSYGACEQCGRAIALARLEALAEARWCLDCATGHEHARPVPTATVPSAPGPLPPEYRELDDDELADAVRERLRAHGDPDLLDVGVRCTKGVVRLTGRIPGESLRQVVRQIIADGMGLEIVDRLATSAVDRELPGETEGPSPATPPAEERIASGAGMRPLGPERGAAPDDEGEPPATVSEDPLPEE